MLRRQFNQALFTKLYIEDEGSVRAELAPPFAILLGDDLARAIEASSTGEWVEASAQNRVSWQTEGFWAPDKSLPSCDGQGLKDELLVGRQGLEPLGTCPGSPGSSSPIQEVVCRA